MAVGLFRPSIAAVKTKRWAIPGSIATIAIACHTLTDAHVHTLPVMASNSIN
jgi:hypothetical protein